MMLEYSHNRTISYSLLWPAAKSAKKVSKAKKQFLSTRDFVYVYEPGVGRTYQCGAYVILVGDKSYACAYKGQTFSWYLEDFLSAVDCCSQFEDRGRLES